MKSYLANLLKQMFCVSSVAIALSLSLPQTAYTKDESTKTLSIAKLDKKLQLKNYQVTKVVDDRKNKNDIGYISTGAHNNFCKALIEKGLTQHLTQHIAENTFSASQTEEVIVHIKDFFLYETSNFKGSSIAIRMHFALFNQQGQRIIDASTTDVYGGGMNMGNRASKLMARCLDYTLKELDTKAAVALVALKTNANIPVEMVYLENTDDVNKIPYSINATLLSKDYLGKVPANSQGEIYSHCGIYIDHQVRVEDNQVKVLVAVLPYMDKAKSWINPQAKNLESLLDYEQVYFKISDKMAQDLADEIQKNGKISMQNLSSTLNHAQEKFETKLLAQQKQFREETEMSKNWTSLQMWSQKLK